jgi:hypothetical protein
VSLADLIVVEVVARRDLHAARAELGIDVGVGDDGDEPVRERQLDLLADEMLVTLVFGVNSDGGVSEHGLGTRGGDHQMTGAVGERIAEVPQVSLFRFGQHFEIGQRGVQHRIPVHEPLAAIDETFLVQPHEHFGDGHRQAFIHGEPITRPVDRVAQAALLLRDGVSRLRLPFPDARDEGFAADVMPVFAFGIELTLDHHLRRDARVIGAGLPQHVVARHAMLARQGVHQGVLERMPHVQRARDVGRRDHDAIRLASAAGRKPAILLPSLIDALLDVARVVSLFHGPANCGA